MTSEQFCYWLRGAIELGMSQFGPEQVKAITDHLDLVLHKVTPDRTKELADKAANPIKIGSSQPWVLTQPTDYKDIIVTCSTNVGEFPHKLKEVV